MASIDRDIIGTVRTAYGEDLQVAKKLGLPHILLENTTLNEKFSVQARVAPPSGIYPNMRYLVIGNLGHRTVRAEDGSDEPVPVRHYAEDAGCYNHLAFVMREVNDDLAADKRRLYGLRREEIHNGRNYFVYYLRRLDFEGVRTQLQRSVVEEDGTVSTTPFIPSTSNLNPVPPEISNTGTVLGSRRSTTSSAVVTVKLTADDVAEIINAHRIRTGSNRSPVISEMGLCSGVDREVTGPSPGATSFRYTETIACQINVFIATNHPVVYSQDGIDFTIDVGGMEPLLGGDDAAAASFLG